MTEQKFTKGKWHFTKRLGSFEMYADRVVEFDIVCNFERSSVSSDETKANALLISHAPAMLQMLQKVSQAFKDANMPAAAIEIDDLINQAATL